MYAVHMASYLASKSGPHVRPYVPSDVPTYVPPDVPTYAHPDLATCVLPFSTARLQLSEVVRTKRVPQVSCLKTCKAIRKQHVLLMKSNQIS